MTDLVVWGGPVYCSTLDVVRWRRPTVVFCKPLEGSENVTYGSSLSATGDPFAALLADARFPGVPGAVGLAGFSAFHGWASDFVGAVGDKVQCLHLADACFQGAGATSGKPGYVAYAKLAASGLVRMTVTSNGEDPDADISYSGPVGSKYEGVSFNLTSGTKCVRNIVRSAFGGDLKPTSFDLPSDLPYKPARMYKHGEFRWLVYPSSTTSDPHGVHIKLAVPLIQAFMVPWLAKSGSAGRFNRSPLAQAASMAAGAAIGAYAARWIHRRRGLRTT